jgi:hypothetical protein
MSTAAVQENLVDSTSSLPPPYMSAFGDQPISILSSKYYLILEKPVPTAATTYIQLSFMNNSGGRRSYDLIFTDPFAENGLVIGGHSGFVTNLLPGDEHTFRITFRIASPAGVRGSRTQSASFKKIYTLLRTWPSTEPSCNFCKLWSIVGKKCNRCGKSVDGTMIEINLAFPAGIDYGYTLFYTVS